MAMINAVYFGMDGLPSFDGQVPIRRINTSDPLTSDITSLDYDSDEYRSIVESLEYKLREAYAKGPISLYREKTAQMKIGTWVILSLETVSQFLTSGYPPSVIK